MPRQKTKARQGCLKKAHDHNRTIRFRSRHVETQSSIRNGFSPRPATPRASDDPLGAANSNILLMMQAQYQ